MYQTRNIADQYNEQKDNTFPAVAPGTVGSVYRKWPGSPEANQHYYFKYTHDEYVKYLLLSLLFRKKNGIVVNPMKLENIKPLIR
jgi:hypothetical protein